MKSEHEKSYQIYLEKINEALQKYMPKATSQKEVIDAMNYSLLAGGKRIRPVLVLEFCRLVGGDVDKALPFACALEMIHTYSLVHDDLPAMDNDDFRRGRPTNHKMFGEAIAVLAGDALLNLAFETVVENTDVGEKETLLALKELSCASGVYGMIGGQTMDIVNEGKAVGEESLVIMHAMKTGALILAGAKMGCIVGGASDEQIKSAERYASNIGLGFQIIDDILNVVGSQEKIGKSVGSDKENGKTTFVDLLGLTEARNRAEKLTDAAMEGAKQFSDCGFLLWLSDMLLKREI